MTMVSHTNVMTLVLVVALVVLNLFILGVDNCNDDQDCLDFQVCVKPEDANFKGCYEKCVDEWDCLNYVKSCKVVNHKFYCEKSSGPPGECLCKGIYGEYCGKNLRGPHCHPDTKYKCNRHKDYIAKLIHPCTECKQGGSDAYPLVSKCIAAPPGKCTCKTNEYFWCGHSLVGNCTKNQVYRCGAPGMGYEALKDKPCPFRCMYSLTTDGSPACEHKSRYNQRGHRHRHHRHRP